MYGETTETGKAQGMDKCRTKSRRNRENINEKICARAKVVVCHALGSHHVVRKEDLARDLSSLMLVTCNLCIIC